MQSWQSKVASWAIVMRAYAARSCAALFVVLSSGCFSLSLTHEIDGVVEDGPLGGRYNIKSVAAPLAEALRKHAPKSIVFTDENSPDAVPLNISVSGILDDTDATSVAQFLPGALTLCMLPAVTENRETRTITLTSPFGKDEIRMKIVGRETVCWTPLGWLPLAFPLDAYDYTACDLLEKWHDEKTQAWSDALHTAAAKAIISMLTKDFYAECMNRQQEERVQKEAEEARKKALEAAHEREKLLRLAEIGWPQESKLREFAIKEMPEIWEMVVTQRADIFSHRAMLLKLRSSLIDFGKVPESDPEYVASRRKYDAERGELIRVLRSIEKACLVSCKNASLYEGAEALEKTKQSVDECVKEVLRSH